MSVPAETAAWEWLRTLARPRVAVGCAVACAIGIALLIWRKPGQVWDDEVARLRAAGYATSHAEWLGPPVPADENGAAEIDAADAWLSASLGAEAEWTTIGPWSLRREPWWQDATPEEIADLQALLVRAEPYLARVAAAARKPHLRWEPGESPFDWHEASAPHLRRVNRMCSAAARFSADPARRVESVATLLRIAARPDRPVDMMEASVTPACAFRALIDLQHCVDSGMISATDAARTLAEVPLPRFANRSADLLRAEIAAWAPVGAEWFLQPLTRRLDSINKPDPGRGVFPIPLRHGEIAAVGMPRVPSSVLRWTWYGPSNLLRDLHRAADVVGPTPRATHAALRPLVLPHDCNRHFEPFGLAVSGIGYSARVDAILGVTKIALAARLARATSGRWPEALSDIAGDFPLDPYTDLPFEYEVVGDAVRVASRGAFAPDAPPIAENPDSDGLVWVLSAK